MQCSEPAAVKEEEKNKKPGVKATVAEPIDTRNFPFVSGPYQKVLWDIWARVDGSLRPLQQQYDNAEQLFAAAGVTDQKLKDKLMAQAHKEVADWERANIYDPAADAEASSSPAKAH